MANNLDLLGSLTRVEVPFIKVTIGNYTFGVYDNTTGTVESSRIAFSAQNIKFPNYIESLEIQKINGQVNKYKLNLFYLVTPASDPNFFEKVFSSVSQSRKIVFSYGDLSMPTYIYRDEEAIITNINTSFDAKSATIKYTVEAISSAMLLNAVNVPYFPARTAQPSTVIYELLQNKQYNLQEIFYGMQNINLIEQNNLIARDDAVVTIQSKSNISILEYLTYLVSCMTPVSDTKSSVSKSGLYVLNVIDDTSGIFAGPYFTVKRMNTNSSINTYTVDMGYPSNNIILNFNVVNNETYSIYYDYANKITQEQYTYRINNQGLMEPVYAPLLSSGNANYQTNAADRSWWTAVTQYPISAELTLKGLLRPAILMNELRFNLYYFGKKHISSGLYLITKQVDTINNSGFRTTLSLVRTGGDDDYSSINSGDYFVINNYNNNNAQVINGVGGIINTATK